MRLLYMIFTLALSGYGLFWLAEKNPDLKQKAEELLDFRTTSALESRYDASQIMEIHQKKLLKQKGARFLDPELKFYPHLLLQVKYIDRNKTKEGLILWDLTDGEMILDTKTWEKTHGFADCILMGAKNYEFSILHFLAKKGGICEESYLQNQLDIDPPVFIIGLRSCLKKNLITLAGNNRYRLHLENPKFARSPQTKISHSLTTKAHKHAVRAPKKFSNSKVERNAKMAFGENFSIRTTTEIYLPVHRIVVQNPDGSIQTFHFNGLNGKELPSALFYQ